MRVWLDLLAGRLLVTGLCLILIAASGCGGGHSKKTGAVSGTVTVNGSPLAVGFVSFEDQTRGLGGSATVKEGAYQFDSPLNVGNYKVCVQPPSLSPMAAPATEPASSVIPDRYRQFDSSTLTVTVVEGVNQFELVLDK